MKDCNDAEVTNPYCTQCTTGATETVEHFLFNCPMYHNHRQIMYNNLRLIWYGFSDPRRITLKNIMFPFLIENDDIADPYNKCPISTPDQARIWKQICRFVKNTKRFNDLYRVDLERLT